MSPVTTLTVPVPQIVLDPPAGPPQLEKPVTVSLGAVRYPDATTLGQDDMRAIGVFVFRGTPGSEEVWDEGTKTWKSTPINAASLAALTPVPMMPVGGGPPDWTGILIAAGQKDASGADRFLAASSGTPRYRLRAFARGQRDGLDYSGLSAQSPDLLFTSAAANRRFAVALDPPESASATTARMVLKNAALLDAGYVEIRTAGGQEVEIANCDTSGAVLARVRLTSSGDIQLEPAAGRRIVFTGPLEADEITYQPHGGGSRLTL
jgi:hypothetical protein